MNRITLLLMCVYILLSRLTFAQTVSINYCSGDLSIGTEKVNCKNDSYKDKHYDVETQIKVEQTGFVIFNLYDSDSRIQKEVKYAQVYAGPINKPIAIKELSRIGTVKQSASSVRSDDLKSCLSLVSTKLPKSDDKYKVFGQMCSLNVNSKYKLEIVAPSSNDHLVEIEGLIMNPKDLDIGDYTIRILENGHLLQQMRLEVVNYSQFDTDTLKKAKLQKNFSEALISECVKDGYYLLAINLVYGATDLENEKKIALKELLNESIKTRLIQL